MRPDSGVRYFLGLLQAVLVLATMVALIAALVTGVQWLERLFEGSNRPETQIERRHSSTTAEGTRLTTTIGETTSSIVEPLPEPPPEAPPTATATPTATSTPTSSATSTPTASATPSATVTSSGGSASPRAGAGALPGSGGAPVLSVAVGILLVGAGIVVAAMLVRRTS